ncbi:hypothetical protein [Actinokineospora enzanensis]|uniref:hypothetical protein n=1 Tax=Actinokineospora enzanensis TaxID=155975 RepID=UPI00039A6AD1|nr:hypothetical protein [Actinokineospora enzanensis]
MTEPLNEQLPEPKVSATAGAGIVDSGANLFSDIMAIKDAQGADIARFGVEIGVDVLALAFDVVKLVFNPFGSLISAGLGWAVEHFEPTRQVLTWIAGDPDQAQLVSQNLHALAEAFTQLDAEFDHGRAGVDQWQGEAATTCKAAMNQHHVAVAALAATTKTVGYIVHGCAAAVGVVRALVRDLITTLVGDAIAAGLIALALTPVTGGTSLIGFVAWLWAQICATVGKAVTQITRVVGLLGRSGNRTTQLGRLGTNNATRTTTNTTTNTANATRTTTNSTSNVANNATRTTTNTSTTNNVTRTSTNTSNNATRTTTSQSTTNPSTNTTKPPATKPYDGPWLKYHEHVLKSRLPDSWTLLKRGEERIKNSSRLGKHYPNLRRMADLDSSKETIGWYGKAGTKVITETTDVQWSAQQGTNAEIRRRQQLQQPHDQKNRH